LLIDPIFGRFDRISDSLLVVLPRSIEFYRDFTESLYLTLCDHMGSYRRFIVGLLPIEFHENVSTTVVMGKRYIHLV